MWARKIKGTTCSVVYSASIQLCDRLILVNLTCSFPPAHTTDVIGKNGLAFLDGAFLTLSCYVLYPETLPLWPGILQRVNTSAICFVAMVVFQVVQSLMPCTTCAVRFLKKRKRLRRVTGSCQHKSHGPTLSTPLHLHQQEVLTL